MSSANNGPGGVASAPGPVVSEVHQVYHVDKPLTSDHEAEQILLGLVLIDDTGGRLAEVSPLVATGDFNLPEHQAVFAALLDMQQRGEPIESGLVQRQLVERGDLDKATAEVLLCACVESTPDVPRHLEYADRVHQIAERRREQQRAIELAQAAVRGDRDAVAAHATAIVSAVRKSTEVCEWQPFPVDALPDAVRAFVSETAAAVGVDPAMVAPHVLATLAGVIGNRRVVRLNDTWTEPAVLWAAVVAPSGSNKSAPFVAATKPAEAIESRLNCDNEAAKRDYERAVETYMREVHEFRRSNTTGEPPERPDEPPHKRLKVQDVTVEALLAVLGDNPGGLLLAVDELHGWVGSFDRYRGGHGADVAHWLSMYDARPAKPDRKTARAVYVPRAAVSVCGTIQPAVFEHLLATVHASNGLIPRLLVAKPPVEPAYWTDRNVCVRTKTQYKAVIERLFDWPLPLNEYGEPVPAEVPLSDAALRVFIDFVNAHARTVAEVPEGLLRSTLAKHKGTAARLALVVHAVAAASDALHVDPDRIGVEHVEAGIELARWFSHEARRLYGSRDLSRDGQRRQRMLDAVLKRGGRATARDVRAVAGGRTDDADRDLDALVKAGLGHWEHTPAGEGGRPTRHFVADVPAEIPKAETPFIPEENGGFGFGGIGGDPADRVQVIL